MEIHNPVIAGKALLHPEHGNYDDDLALVPRAFVVSKAAGLAVIKDITPTNVESIVGFKEYVADTVPSDFVLDAATANTNEVTITVYARPRNNSMSDTFQVNGTDVEMAAVNGDPSMLEGTIDLVLDDQVVDHIISVTGPDGIQHDVALTLLIGGPAVGSVDFTLPGVQSAVKQNDVVAVTGTIDNTALEAYVVAGGVAQALSALTLGAEDSGGAGLKTFSGNFTVSSVASDAAFSVAGKNALGTEGDLYSSADVPVDQAYPVIGTASYSYPAGQSALKDGESVDITVSVTGQTEIAYNVPAGHSVADDTVYAATKTVTVTSGAATYSFNNNNYEIVATKASNGAVTTRTFTIDVANVAPNISLTWVNNPAYLRTSQAGIAYTLRVNSDQPLASAPDSLDAAVGAYTSAWAASGTTRYTIEYTVYDSDPRGVATFSNLSITGRSGLEQNTIASGASYTIRGLELRDLVVPALSQMVAIGSNVFDTSNVTVSYKGADVLEFRPDKSQYAKGFTIVDDQGNVDANGDYVFITDAIFAGSNTSGTLTLEFEEA